MLLYRAYGLGIASELPLPELMPGDGAAEVSEVFVRRGEIDAATDADSVVMWAKADDVCLRYKDVAAFRITGGNRIIYDPHPSADERAVRLLLTGGALAVLLHQRGFLVLHASGVAIDGRATAFVGEKGEGKSTLAAALHARGHGLLADDVVAVDPHARPAPLAYPGFPQLKLWPEAVAGLGGEPDALPRVYPGFEKRGRRADERFPADPLPLDRVYVLESGERNAIETLSPQQRFIELTRHSYLLSLLGRTGETAAHFYQAADVAARVPVLRLLRRRALDDLSSIAQRVEENMRSDTPHAGAERSAAPDP